MFYFDTVKYLDYTFYLVTKNDELIFCSINKDVIKNATFNTKKLLPYTSFLKEYFKGNNLKSNLTLSFNKKSFTNSVHQELINIPYGTTKSYKDIALLLNKPNASRAVGNAVGRNDLLIFIPCHRVIKSNGLYGGFSAGVDLKIILLKLEQTNKK